MSFLPLSSDHEHPQTHINSFSTSLQARYWDYPCQRFPTNLLSTTQILRRFMENRKEIDLFKVGSVFSMAPVARIFYIFSHCTYCIKSWLLKPVVDLKICELDGFGKKKCFYPQSSHRTIVPPKQTKMLISSSETKVPKSMNL